MGERLTLNTDVGKWNRSFTQEHVSGILCMPGLTCDSDMKACALEETRYLAHKNVRQALTLWNVFRFFVERKRKR